MHVTFEIPVGEPLKKGGYVAIFKQSAVGASGAFRLTTFFRYQHLDLSLHFNSDQIIVRSS
jgi:hypothetical protein